MIKCAPKPFLLDAYSIPFPPGFPKKGRTITVLSSISLQGVFDESGKLNDSKVVAIAGYVSSPLKWNRFTKEWQGVLDEYGIKVFHASECEFGYGEFKCLDKVKRTELVKRLAPIINKHILFGVCIAIYIEEYNEATKGKTEKCHAMIEDPYYYCFMGVVYELIPEQIKKRATISYEKIKLIFDQNEEMEGRAQQYFAHSQNDHSADIGQGLYVGGVDYEDKAQFIPLQAADLLVYNSAKHLRNLREHPELPMRKCLEVLVSTNKIKGLYPTKESLKQLVAVMIEQNAF